MTTEFSLTETRRFKIGWIVLLTAAVLMTLNHLLLIFVLNEPTLFIGYAAFNLYAAVVLYVPFRQGQTWAWLTTWILPVALAAPAFADPGLAVFYVSVAVICVLGLLLSMNAFFRKA